jgi:hypothetical protein
VTRPQLPLNGVSGAPDRGRRGGVSAVTGEVLWGVPRVACCKNRRGGTVTSLSDRGKGGGEGERGWYGALERRRERGEAGWRAWATPGKCGPTEEKENGLGL